jgi:hypothetical protein
MTKGAVTVGVGTTHPLELTRYPGLFDSDYNHLITSVTVASGERLRLTKDPELVHRQHHDRARDGDRIREFDRYRPGRDPRAAGIPLSNPR